MKTNRKIEYAVAPYGLITVIPKGTPVKQASNLPQDGVYWAEEWPNMSDKAYEWIRNYGFLIDLDDID